MSSPDGYYNGAADQQEEYAVQEQLNHSFSPPNNAITRTVAIIKYHALDHRFDIERRIQEASFEIVKERQMEFDTETDPETLEELFGEDTHSLAEGPVWVYVLERRRAVEVWHTLMGPIDPEQAREEAPNSLRALYGISTAQNGLMGAPDNETAEIQIASLFASSPPFPTSELPPEDGEGNYNSLAGQSYDEGYAPSSARSPSTANGSSSKFNSNGKPTFKARAVPASIAKPDIVPRMTKAAALRTGQPVEKTVSSPRKPVSKERQAETFANVPGHKRAESIAVASTAAPAIAPRMTRAAALRLGVTPAPQPTRTKSTDGPKKSTFEGVPGHKRRETISVASVQAPTVAPRLNKSASLRAQKDQAPPTSFMFKGPTAPKAPGSLSRSNSSEGGSPARTRPASQASVTRPKPQAAPAPAPRRPAPRPSSVAAARPTHDRSASATPSSARATKANGNSDPEQAAAAAPAAKPRPRPSSVCAPSIQPRTNKSAALRQAKKEAEAAAAAAALAKKAPKGVRPPPSSFKTVAT